MQANMEIRNTAKRSGVRLWEVAEAIGITDAMFSRKLRRELPEAERRKLLNVVADLAHRKVAEANENEGN